MLYLQSIFVAPESATFFSVITTVSISGPDPESESVVTPGVSMQAISAFDVFDLPTINKTKDQMVCRPSQIGRRVMTELA